ncbi:intracellular growth attenuator family protein, partial [Salmonella enterica subsp. enterica serovar Lubbock]|nr:intracellular growth attenuator family protein [Salmonella enterica subsp. enterica serovar Lubbock]
VILTPSITRYGITTDDPNKWRYYLDSVEVHLPPFWEQYINDETDFPLQIEEISAGDILDDGLRKVTAFRLEHPLECYGYRVVEH